MNYQCSVCLKDFKHKYLLQRHYKRKTKCKEPIKEIEKDNFLLEKKVIELDSELKETKEKVDKIQKEINSQPTKQNTEYSYKCKFCNKPFAFQNSLSRHLNRGYCSEKNDNISIYQRELGIEPKMCSEDKICKYCLFSFSTKQA